ncbi:flagellar biosynthetic protein FliR [Paenibacillus oleatilyticus]|uniref:flagellar biosynthetic protein FliR n=1 Tax=Paenibacillus oleatilyticus TaxID=2594886 RepID=UPI001C1FDDC9|nr:flagellar biosynthetic protein FliR [Paenibacillus oleatilyticus]MBU7317345.1 flagellar type III secretion system protein FliR [Paenibacillus oleatilyticus]
MEWVLQYLPGFLLFFCRISSFFVIAPVFAARNVPMQLKVGLSFFVAFITFFSIGLTTPVAMDSLYILSVFREVFVGLTLGFIAYMFFQVVQISGAFIDLQMGFGIANVIDPLTGAQSPILGNLKYMIAMLLFLSFNGHHYLLEGIMRSYEWIPLNNELFVENYNGQLSDFMLKTFSQVFAISFQMAAPLVVAMFLTDVGLGLLARVAPQFNIFVIGIPVKIIVGFILLLLLFPGYELIYKEKFSTMLETMAKFFGLFTGS